MTHSFLNKQGLTHFWELIKSKIPFHLTKVLYGGLGNIVADENGNILVDENGNTITAGATTSLIVNNIEDNSADAAYSTAMGDHTIATQKGSLAVGNYNQTGDYLFVVGNGNSSQRSNAFMVMSNNVAVAGKLSIGQEGTADNNVVTKKYVDDAFSDVNDELDVLNTNITPYAATSWKGNITNISTINNMIQPGRHRCYMINGIGGLPGGWVIIDVAALAGYDNYQQIFTYENGIIYVRSHPTGGDWGDPIKLPTRTEITSINDEIDAIHDEIEFKFRNTIRCESITLNQTSVTGWVGSLVQITSPTLSPSDTTDTVRWKSNDVSVANVTSTGAITGISAGYTAVTVMCGDRSGTINATVYQELPKTIGLLGYGSWDSDGSLYNINYSVTRGYTLAYNEYPIRPGQTVKIEITDGSRYALYDCGIYTGTPNIVELPQYTVVQHQNINRQTDLGSWWDVGTRLWTNTLSENAYLYICVAFRGGIDGRSETTDAVTSEQLATFQNGDGMKIWIEPGNADTSGGTGQASIEVPMWVTVQAIEDGDTYDGSSIRYDMGEQVYYGLKFDELDDLLVECVIEANQSRNMNNIEIYSDDVNGLPPILCPVFYSDHLPNLYIPFNQENIDNEENRIIVNMDVVYETTGVERNVKYISIDPNTKGLPTRIELYYSIIM